MAYGFLFIAALASLLIHELGHYLIARSLKVPVTQVTIGAGPEVLRYESRCTWSIRLLPLAAFVRHAGKRSLGIGRMAAIALAGPAANVLVGTMLLAAARMKWHTISSFQQQVFRPDWMTVLPLVGALSIAIGAFNLLPLPPLDGGVLVLLTWEKAIGRQLSPRSTRTANAIGTLIISVFTGWVVLWSCERLIS